MVFVFGDLELDERRFELRRAGQAVAIQPKALELLLYLVRQPGRVVGKAELLQVLWPGTAVTDNSVARAVSLARLAIGDRGAAPRRIVTVPRRGYRFQGAVQTRDFRSLHPETRSTSCDGTSAGYVGRAALLGRLGALLDAALDGRGRILLLVGEAGIGKTRTAEVLALRAAASGAGLAAAWTPGPGAPSLWAWGRIVRGLHRLAPEATQALTPAHRAELVRLLPELRDRAPPREAGRHEEARRVLLFESVLELLASATRERPIALFLDDLHALDAASLALLEFIGPSLAALPVAIVATAREGEAELLPRRARALERLQRLTLVDRWALEGLRGDDLRAFARSRLGGEPPDGLVEALERKTGGNPLLLAESLRSLDAHGLLTAARDPGAWDALLPRGIEHLLRPKLRPLSEGALEMLACAAALGLEVERSLLTRCAREPSALGTHLRECEAAGLLATTPRGGLVRFAHALVRDALYQELAPPGHARRMLHSRIAAALAGDTAPSDEAQDALAHHACEGVPHTPPARAAAWAHAAGERAARLHDYEKAAAWHERSLAAAAQCPDATSSELAALALSLATARSRAAGLERARDTFRVAAGHARAARRADLLAEAALGLAHRPVASGDGDPEVIALLEEALDAGPALAEPLRVRMLSRLAGELRYAERDRAESLAEAALAAARRLGDPAVLAETLDDASFVRWSPADPEGWIELNREIVRAARAAGDLELALRGHKGRVTGLLELGDVTEVDREIRACETTAETLRTPWARWLCAVLRAMRALLDGAIEAAERHVGEAVLQGERIESMEVALELQAQRVYLHVEQGRASEIEAAARAQAGRFPGAPAWRAGLARVLVATGRSDEAEVELRRLARKGFTDVPRDRGWLPTLALAAEVAVACGDAGTARVLEELLAPYARLAVVAGSGLLYYGSVAHHLGLLATASGRWHEAIVRFESALAAEQGAGARVWAARSQLGCVRALLGREAPGDRARAADLLSAARATAKACALEALAAETRALDLPVWSRGSRARRGPSAVN